jgi:hypothetical protein
VSSGGVERGEDGMRDARETQETARRIESLGDTLGASTAAFLPTLYCSYPSLYTKGLVAISKGV